MVFRWIHRVLWKITGRDPKILEQIENLDLRELQARMDYHRLYMRTRFYYLRTLGDEPCVEQLDADGRLLEHGVRACVCNVVTVYAKQLLCLQSETLLGYQHILFAFFTLQLSMQLQTSCAPSSGWSHSDVHIRTYTSTCQT